MPINSKFAGINVNTQPLTIDEMETAVETATDNQGLGFDFNIQHGFVGQTSYVDVVSDSSDVDNIPLSFTLTPTESSDVHFPSFGSSLGGIEGFLDRGNLGGGFQFDADGIIVNLAGNLSDLAGSLSEGDSSTSPVGNLNPVVGGQTDTPGGVVNQMIKDLVSKEKTIINSPDNVSEILIERGLDQNQPEILSVVSFLPTVGGQVRTTAGQMLDLQFFARELATNDTAHIITSLEKDPILKPDIDRLRVNYEGLTELISGRISTFSSIFKKLEGVKACLDLKDNPGIQAAVQSLRETRGAQYSQGSSTMTLTTPPLGSHSTFRDILVCDLKFSDSAYATFSNSKILAQILTDLRGTLEGFSPQLLTPTNSERETDRDPTTIHTSTVPLRRLNFTFKPSDITSETLIPLGDVVATNFTEYDPGLFSNFRTFIESLPPDEVSRMKLLTTLLSKELRMSSGIGRQSGTPVDARYNVASVGLMTRIFGSIGDNIVGPAGVYRTLAGLVRLSDDAGNVILPFETRTIIDPGTDISYIPGSVFFVDTVVDSDNRPEVQPLRDLSLLLQSVINDATAIFTSLLNFDDLDETLHFASVIDLVLENLSTKIEGMGGDQEDFVPEIINKPAVLSFALLNAGQMDLELKHLLYKYIREIRSGTVTINSTSSAQDDTTGGGPGSIDGGPQETNTDSPLDVHGIDLQMFEDETENARTSRSSSSNVRKEDENPVEAETDDPVESADPVIVLGSISLPEAIESRCQTLFGGSTASRLGSPFPSNQAPTAPIDTATVDGWNVSFVPGEIESTLNDFANPHMIFATIANMMDDLTSQADDLSGQGPSTDPKFKKFKTSSGFTKMNKYSDDTLLMLLFEIVSSYSSEFVASRFNIGTGTSLTVTVDSNQNLSMVSKIQTLLGHLSSYGIGTSYLNRTDLMESVRSSIVHEDSLLRDLVDVVKAIPRDAAPIINDAVRFFENLDDPDVKAVFEKPSDADILKNLSKTHLALSWRGLTEVLQTADSSLLPNDQVISETQKNGIDTILRDPKFSKTKGSDVKLISVGLAAGTLEALQNPPFTVGGRSLESSTADLVTVNIFRRDPRYPDVVFKPLKFVFDVSRFVNEYLNVSTLLSFEHFLLFLKLDDIGDSGVISSETLAQIKVNTEYASLSETQKVSMFKNHIEDYFLKMYVRLMTGLSFGEFDFVADESRVRGNKIAGVVQKAIENIAEVVIEDLPQADSDVINEATNSVILNGASSVNFIVPGDLAGLGVNGVKSNPGPAGGSSLTNSTTEETSGGISFELGSVTETPAAGVGTIAPPSPPQADPELLRQYQRLLNSLLFRATDHMARVEHPKLFERIFFVAVDPDEFEIDVDATTLPYLGPQILRNLVQKGLITEKPGKNGVVKLFLNASTVEFSEFFTVVDLGVTL